MEAEIVSSFELRSPFLAGIRLEIRVIHRDRAGEVEGRLYSNLPNGRTNTLHSCVLPMRNRKDLDFYIRIVYETLLAYAAREQWLKLSTPEILNW